MIKRDEEQIENMLCRLLIRQSRQSVRTDCPDEESLASYLSGDMTEDGKSQLDGHLAQCAVCLDNLSAAHQVAQGDQEEAVPERVLERAEALVPSASAEPSLFDLVVRLVRDSLELVSTSGQLVTAAVPVGIRGKAAPSGTTIFQVEKELEKFKVAVEVERVEGEHCQIAVKVKAKGGSVSDGIRLSLVFGGREQASYLARHGTAIFDRIPPGEYRLAVSQNGHSLGSVRLTIREGSS